MRAGVRLSDHQFQALVPLVHRFSLMTYDYGGSVQGGNRGVPNSPLRWVRECVEAFAPAGLGRDLREKVLIGLPFYGECLFFFF